MADTKDCGIVAVFSDYATAERAVRDLIDNGFSRDEVKVQSNFMTGAAGRSTGSTAERGAPETSWWNRLFPSSVPEENRGHYAEAVRRGDALVCVSAGQGDSDRAVKILDKHSPIDIDTRAEYFRKSGYKRFDPTAPAFSADEAERDRQQFKNFQDSIPVVEEELQVGKRSVSRGGVRVYSHVVEQPVEEQIRLREEHVRVERRPVDREMSERDVDALRDQSIEVTESAEEPVVNKRARVKEEVVIGKEATERTERIRDTVRRTEVEVENLGGKRGEDYRNDFRRDYDANYARSGATYETYEPAYTYGSRIAGDPKYKGKSWKEVEPQLRSDYEQRYPNSKWDQMKNAVRYGWDRVSGKH